MNTHLTYPRTLGAGLLLLLLTLKLQVATVSAQGTAFTYQGRLNQNGAPANGAYDLRFKLFVDPVGNTQIGSAVLTNGVPVANGLFIVSIDFGAGLFNGSNYWLEVDVRTNAGTSYTDLGPLQALTPVPYAVFAENAANGTLAAGTYTNAVSLNNPSDSFLGAFVGNGAGLTNVSAATLGGLSAANFWTTSGNSGTSPTNGSFVGTMDFQPLDVRVNNTRAVEWAPTTNTVNIIGGDARNFVAPGVYGATIGGGGTPAYPGGTGLTNVVLVNFGTVGGGTGNKVGSNPSGSGDSAAVAGGWNNLAFGNNTFVGGGGANANWADDAVVAGGYLNSIQTNASSATIGGGTGNGLGNSAFNSTIGGGYYNSVGSPWATISGGGYHFIGTNSNSGTISGGYSHTIQSGSYDCAIGGGSYSSIGSNSYYSTIAGGRVNSVGANATSSSIGGGLQNGIGAGSIGSTIAGGANHMVGTNASEAVISGGEANVIQDNADHSSITGGQGNTIAINAEFAAIDGGQSNIVGNSFAFVAGGVSNFAGGFAAMVSGGTSNAATGGNSFAAGSGSTANGSSSFALGNRAQANADGCFVWADSQSSAFGDSLANSFFVRAKGGVRFTSGLVTADQNVSWAPGAGAWSFTSDRNAKDRFTSINPELVLENVCRLSLTEWSYKGYPQRHIGPMAQDWHEVFPLNEDEKVLNELDVQGVALAAIQGLNRKLEQKDTRLQEQEKKIEKLEQSLAQVTELLNKMRTKHDGGF